MSYYQKYRPQKIEDLDLDSVRNTLLGNLKSGKFAHAYLFVGPRGAGKTSTARILSSVINCEKNWGKKEAGEACGECVYCKALKGGAAVDFLEMDAASHRGIDDIRDLREKINLAPSLLHKKVYIIDEVHMLTNEAFNALLKTLEEPPEHATFFLCTTETHKVPETIVSRCVKVGFTKASENEVLRSLKKAVEGEGIKIGEEALLEVARATDGSFREGHKILEQLVLSGKELTEEVVRELLGNVGYKLVDNLIELSVLGSSKELVMLLKEIEKSGVKAGSLVNDLLTRSKEMLEKQIEVDGFKKYAMLIDRLIMGADRIRFSPIPILPIELALLEVSERVGKSSQSVTTKSGVEDSMKSSSTNAGVKKSALSGSEVEMVKTAEEKKTKAVLEMEEEMTDSMMGNKELADIGKVQNEWEGFLKSLAYKNASIAGLLRSSSPVAIADKSLTLEVFYPFHRDQLTQDARRKVLEDEMSKVWGVAGVKCVLSESKKAAVSDQRVEIGEDKEVKSDKSVDEIFGV